MKVFIQNLLFLFAQAFDIKVVSQLCILFSLIHCQTMFYQKLVCSSFILSVKVLADFFHLLDFLLLPSSLLLSIFLLLNGFNLHLRRPTTFLHFEFHNHFFIIRGSIWVYHNRRHHTTWFEFLQFLFLNELGIANAVHVIFWLLGRVL